jgi:predicted transcriptional regulator
MTETKRKRGRPVRTAPRVAVTWRLPVNLLFRVDEVADAEGLTTTAWVERAIEAAFAARRKATPSRT